MWILGGGSEDWGFKYGNWTARGVEVEKKGRGGVWEQGFLDGSATQ